MAPTTDTEREQPRATPGPGPAPARVAPRSGLDARVRVPGSKSISNRALVVAALARGESRLSGLLQSEDIDAMSRCLGALGVEIAPATESAAGTWRVGGTGGALRAPDTALDVHASGTAMRLLTAVATLAPGPVEIDGTARLRERPAGELVAALDALGAGARALGPGGCPPLRVAGGGLEGGSATIDARRSSQFVSAVLLVAPLARRDVRLALRDGVLASRPYVDVTLRCMQAFGAEARWAGDALEVSAGRGYRGRAFAIEPDASTAAYFFCAAALAGGRVRVEGLPGDSLQADMGLLDVLAAMGCRVERAPDGVAVRGPDGPLRGVDVDMNAMPDAVLALAVTAAFAEGTTRIRNVAHLRLKESDRLAALETELRRLGAGAQATGAGDLVVEPAPLRAAEIETYDDHRMAMAFALAGLRVPGISIRDPGCVAKSWPKYFEALEGL